jgi:uncharacterized protein YndB with AHSA1/START domain
MTTELTLKKSININASTARVWEALTNPELIKIYFFGTECISEWKNGSPILYKGIYEGKAYEDKGNILDIEKEKFILYNYWSSFSKTEDIPANYSVIKYELSADKNETTFTITQAGFKTQETHDHSATNWGYVMDGLKKMLEA